MVTVIEKDIGEYASARAKYLFAESASVAVVAVVSEWRSKQLDFVRGTEKCMLALRNLVKGTEIVDFLEW
jgi:hypothetical protein